MEDSAVVSVRTGDPARSHAERLPQDILDLLREAGTDAAAIDLYAVAAGPGMFTGLRIGIATIQGLAFVHRRQVAPVSALRALAECAADGLSPGAIVAAWMDAHRRDVFAAAYRVDAPGTPNGPASLTELAPPSVETPAATLERWRAGGLRPEVVCGDGAVLFASTLPADMRVLAPPPLAPAIAALALAAYRDARTVAPAAVQPLYVRRPDAEVARDARSATQP